MGGYDEYMRNGYEDWEFYIACQLLKMELLMSIKEFLFNYTDKSDSRNKIAKWNYHITIKNFHSQKYEKLCKENFEVLFQPYFSRT